MTTKIYTVSTVAELQSILARASGGDTILLKEGDYGTLKMTPHETVKGQFSSAVTIISADPDRPASFSGLGLNGVSNITFDNIKFDYTYNAGDQQSTKDFVIHSSNNVVIRNSVFDGDVAKKMSANDDGFGMSTGLDVRWSTGVVVKNTEFKEFYRAMSISESSNVKVIGNDIYDIRADGMNFAAVKNVLIEDNHIHDFAASYNSGDHRDMIQFWTAGTTIPSTNITIRGNTLDIGDGSYTQAIFMRNEAVDTGKAGQPMFYQNVMIEDNTIYNGHSHGITVGEAKGLTIRDNTVVRVVDNANVDQSDSMLWVPQINVAAKSQIVTIQNNITGGITGFSGQSGWTVNTNAVVQDTNPHAAGYYGNVFIASSMASGIDGANNFIVRPGSAVDKLGAGSSDTVYASYSARTDAEFHVTESANSAAVRVFDASFSTGPQGALPAGTVYQWEFGDRTTAIGKIVEHSFQNGGTYAVKLTVRLPDGTTSQEIGKVAIEGTEVISFGPDGKFHAFAYGQEQLIAVPAAVLGIEMGAKTLNLGGAGTLTAIKGAHLSSLRGSDNFDIDMTLKADIKGSIGEIFRSVGAFTATINIKGELQVVMTTTTTPTVAAVTKGVVLNDGKDHNISISFDDGALRISVDGKEAAVVSATGTLLPVNIRDLMFGNPWGQTNFNGTIRDFDITTDANDYLKAKAFAAQSPLAPATPEPASLHEPIQDGTKTDAPGEHIHNWQDYGVDLQGLVNSKAVRLFDNAKLTGSGDTLELKLDGTKDYAALGRIKQYETSERIAFEVGFQRDDTGATSERLVWNHQKIGLSVRDDGLIVTVGTAAGLKAFAIKGLGLNDTDVHEAMVMLDTKNDRLQVVLDDKVVMDIDNVDFKIVGAGGRESGWTLGSAWNEEFDGIITDFRLGDQFEFLNNYVPDPNALLV